MEKFTEQNTSLAAEIRNLQSSKEELVQQHVGNEKKEHTTLEKNQLWKLVLKKVTVYRSQDDELSIQLYPNLPK